MTTSARAAESADWPAPAALRTADFVASFAQPGFARWSAVAPWELTAQSEAAVRQLLSDIVAQDFVIADDIAVHRSAVVEANATLKGPLVIGPRCFVAAGAYVRGGSWIAEGCTLGPGVEVKSSFVFADSTLAHFNFVGDSILGSDVNLEAGSIVCNHRNERADDEVQVRLRARLHRTGTKKFGAVIGDGSRIGANAVVAPGALLRPGAVVPRAALVDQEMSPSD